METSTLVVIALAIAAVAAGIVVAWTAMHRKRQTDELRAHFGEEYDRVMQVEGDQHVAEQELWARREQHDELDLRDLSPTETDQFVVRWREVKARFVDDPAGAVADADRLLSDVMRARGYDLSDRDDAEDRDVVDLVSVDHPDVVNRYREGNRLYRRAASGEGTTEDLRQAMVCFRDLFDRLLATASGSSTDTRR